MDAERDYEFADEREISEHRKRQSHYLVFSDGGVHDAKTAATGWVVFALEPVAGAWLHTRLAYQCKNIQTGLDSMQAEVQALLHALNFLQAII